MDQLRAIRHLLLAEIRTTADRLEASGATTKARRLHAFADDLHFRPLANASGAEAALRVSAKSDPGAALVLPREDFQLYKRNSGEFSPTDVDLACEQNHRAIQNATRVLLATSRDVGDLLDDVKQHRQLPLLNKVTGDSVLVGHSAISWALLGLMVATFCVSLWQGTRQFNFFDSTYLLENIHRIRQGDVPYRDFSLVLPPIHYYFQLAIHSVAGDRVFGLLFVSCIMQSLLPMLCFMTCRMINPDRLMNLFCAAISASGGITLVGFPLYDTDAGFFFVCGVMSLLLWERNTNYPFWLGMVSGSFFALVALTKYNMGLPVLLGLCIVLSIAKFLYPRMPLSRTLVIPCSAATLIGLVLGTFAIHGAFDDLVQQTWVLPSQKRLDFWPNLLAAVPWPIDFHTPWSIHGWIWRFVLMIGCVLPFVGWLTGTHRHPLAFLTPILCVAIILGAFQSQQLGSLYGVYPALAIIICGIHRAFSPLFPRFSRILLIAISLTLLLTSWHMIAANRRLNFLAFPTKDVVPIDLPHLSGMNASRHQQDRFNQMIDTSESMIPPSDTVYFFPGDGPFYYVTGRRCPVRNYQAWPDTGFDESATILELSAKRVDWLIVEKRWNSLKHKPPALDGNLRLSAWMSKEYERVHHANGYSFLRRHHNEYD